MYQFTKEIQNDPQLRASFNALAEATFGLNFEGWHRNGFWGPDYRPYAMVCGGEVVANVSLNRTDLIIGGRRRRIYQLGTVMTAPEHRNKGLIRAIMAEIEKDTADAEGVYLFAGDGVLDFYPKFGFTRGVEYVHTKSVSQTGNCTLEQIPMDGPAAWDRLASAMQASTFPAGCAMADNPGLIFFYVSQFMQDCVYHHEPTDTWIIAEPDGEELTIHNVFTKAQISLEKVIHSFGADIKHITLGFTPAESTGWEICELHEDDCTFFVKGNIFEEFHSSMLRIPSLSHA